MTTVNIQITMPEGTQDIEIQDFMDRIEGFVSDDNQDIDYISADWMNEDTGDINYFTP